MDQSAVQPWLLVLAVAVVASFAIGVIWNIRRGNATLRWMQGGLTRLGSRTTVRWLGSSVVEMTIAKARSPFRQAQIVLVMSPRDVPWLWLLAGLRGRRDLFILRGQLVNPPRTEYGISDPASWTGRRSIVDARKKGWGEEALGDHLLLAPKPSLPASLQQASAVLEAAHSVDPRLWRLSVQREYPQLELHVPLPGRASGEPEAFFESICRLAQAVA